MGFASRIDRGVDGQKTRAPYFAGSDKRITVPLGILLQYRDTASITAGKQNRAPRPHVLVLAAYPRLCLALPWHRRRRCGTGALAPPAPANIRGLPAPPRTAPPIRHGAAMRVCGPARLWTSVAGTARAARHARAWQSWRGRAHTLGVRHPQTPARPQRSVVRLVFY
jgi:hypothetical protein